MEGVFKGKISQIQNDTNAKFGKVRQQLATKTDKIERGGSKSDMSAKWFVRVDGPKEHLVTKCKLIQGWVDIVCILAAFHVGEKKENPHVHFVIEIKSEIQKQSFAVRIKSLFGITKKTEYAIAVWDGERGAGACSYLFHEPEVEILVNKGFTDDDLERAKLANDAVQRVVAVNKEKASHKLVERAYSHFNDGKEFSRVSCLIWMLKEIKAGEHYHPGEFMLKRYVEEIEVRLSDDIESLAWEMSRRLWRD